MLRAPGTQGHPEAFRLAMVHLPARLAQLGHEVAQGAPEQHQPLAVQRQPLQRATAFDQQNVTLALGLSRAQPDQQIPQGRLGERELILEDQDANAHRSGTSRLPSLGHPSSNLGRACGAGEGSGLFRLPITAAATTPTACMLRLAQLEPIVCCHSGHPAHPAHRGHAAICIHRHLHQEPTGRFGNLGLAFYPQAE